MKPFTQGSLEYTCGLYAIVNSIRMATDTYMRLSKTRWFELYFALTEAADEKVGGTGSIIREGLSSTEMKILLRAANQWMVKTSNRKVVWEKPYTRGYTPTHREYIRTMRKHTTAGGTAIVGLGGQEDHWTCLYDITDRSFILCDSDGMTSLPIASLRAKKVRVDPPYTFLIGIN